MAEGSTYYITTPIYYANAPLHMGSAYEIVGCDVLARFHRLAGRDVYFLTGLDEHGEKVQKAAEDRQCHPKEFVDRMARRFEAFCEALLISKDDIIRTTQPRHRRVVEAFWREVRAKGDIYPGEYRGLYCSRCENYIRPSDATAEGCPACQGPLRQLAEKAFFFKLSKYRPALLKMFNERPDFVRPDFRRTEMLRILEGGLEDVCVSRSSIHWGIPVPDEPGEVIYVWFDALVNYISAIGYLADEEHFNRYWPADLHVVGKDILRWHTLLWPAMLMAADLPIAKQVFGHGFVYVKGGKMSKSLGNVVEPRQVAEKYGADALRYFLMREIPFGNDGNYSEETLVERYNTDLANELGNLVLRTLSMIDKYFNGSVPKPAGDEMVLAPEATALADEVPSLMDELAFSRALERTWQLVRRANRFIEEREPWRLAKTDPEGPALAGTMYQLAECLRILSVVVAPFMPEKAGHIRTQLGLDSGIETLAAELQWGRLAPGTHVAKGKPLFPKIELEEVG